MNAMLDVIPRPPSAINPRHGIGGASGRPLPSGGVSWILLTNDDGVDSPALMPFRAALARLGEVRVVVPDSERSWIGKALTRFDPIEAAEVEREGNTLVTVSGFPADAVQIAAAYFDTPPHLVVSGINLGYNHGTGYIASSGTVGAALEGWELGIPAVAFSAGCRGEWADWYQFMHSEAAIPAWNRLADLCAGLLEEIRSVEMPGDVVSVNVPWEADSSTKRRVVPAARVSYGQIHEAPSGRVVRPSLSGTVRLGFPGRNRHRGQPEGRDRHHPAAGGVLPLRRRRSAGRPRTPAPGW